MVNSDPLDHIAQQIRSRRKSLRLTQDDLANLSGCSPRFIRMLEAGKPSVRFDKLAAVLDALGLVLTASRRDTTGLMSHRASNSSGK